METTVIILVLAVVIALVLLLKIKPELRYKIGFAVFWLCLAATVAAILFTTNDTAENKDIATYIAAGASFVSAVAILFVLPLAPKGDEPKDDSAENKD